MEAARSIREDYLQQNAFHEVDTYASSKKQLLMLKLVLKYYDLSVDALEKDAEFSQLASLKVREAIGRFKYTPEEQVEEKYAQVEAQLIEEIEKISEGGERINA